MFVEPLCVKVLSRHKARYALDPHLVERVVEGGKEEGRGEPTASLYRSNVHAHIRLAKVIINHSRN